MGYARKYSGFTLEQIASKLKISIAEVELYETNACQISITHLEKLSTFYKRPLAFFFLSSVPSDAVIPRDFRIVYASEENPSFSPKEYLAIRQARYIQSMIADLSEDEFRYDFRAISLSDNPEEVGDYFRKYLGLKTATQFKWRDPSTALREWKNILGYKQIFVLQSALPRSHMSAFCLIDKAPYVLMLNSSEDVNRRIFSLFHEIGHILLNKSGICTPEDFSRNSYEYIQIEKFCNAFAAAFLVPQEEFLKDDDVIKMSKGGIDDEGIFKIAAKFKTSSEVVLRRLLSFKYIDEAFYKARKGEWKKKYEAKPVAPKKKIIIPQYRKCLNRNGRAFTLFVLNQYHSDRISYSAASEILNVKAKYISQLEASAL